MVEDGEVDVANDFIPFSDHQEKNVLDNLRIITG
jgi:hypothetical protein